MMFGMQQIVVCTFGVLEGFGSRDILNVQSVAGKQPIPAGESSRVFAV
jgi:hypothetical protein